MMHKSDWITLAQAISRADTNTEVGPAIGRDAKRRIAHEIARTLLIDNPRFDIVRWDAATR